MASRIPGHPVSIRHSPIKWSDQFLYVPGRLVLTGEILTMWLEDKEEFHKVFHEVDAVRSFCDLTNLGVGVIDFMPGLGDPSNPGFGAETDPVPAIVRKVGGRAWKSGVAEISPDYVLTSTGHANFYPQRPPGEPSGSLYSPAGLPDTDADEPAIGVIDIGFDNNFSENPRVQGMELPDVSKTFPDPFTPEFWHGEWVAWIIRRHAKKAPIYGLPVDQIWASAVPGSGGTGSHVAISDTLLGAALNRMLDETSAKIVTITAGGPVGAGSSMPTTQAAVKKADSKGVLVVAAIGNDTREHTVYPAEYEEVLAVGSLVPSGPSSSVMADSPLTDWSEKSWGVAVYNNHKEAVDLFAPGVLNVPFRQGSWNIDTGSGPIPVDFTQNMASIEGTSFAVPVAAGVLAAKFDRYVQLRTQSGKTVRDAANDALKDPSDLPGGFLPPLQ